jgi:hypothetical protein
MTGNLLIGIIPKSLPPQVEKPRRTKTADLLMAARIEHDEAALPWLTKNLPTGDALCVLNTECTPSESRVL